MITFAAHLVESKFREVSDSYVDISNQIADEYLKLIRDVTSTDKKKYKREKLHPSWQQYFKDAGDNVWFLFELNNVKFKDLKTNKMTTYEVYVAFGENNQNYAMCDSADKLIVLYEDTCRELSREKLISTIYHEITHGFQQHKEYSNKYQRLLKQNSPKAKAAADDLYHKEPIEFDAFMTELSYTIKTEYKQIKNDIVNSKMPETKKIMEKRLEKFLLELKLFINSPLDNYFIYKELPLPSPLSTFDSMLKSIQQTPKLWKSFKYKMLNLYNDLQTSKS